VTRARYGKFLTGVFSFIFFQPIFLSTLSKKEALTFERKIRRIDGKANRILRINIPETGAFGEGTCKMEGKSSN
jgi:hypothetical protein